MNNIEKVVIVGGGTAGWMTAAALSKVLASETDIVLIESDQIGTVGVGEATIPSIRLFNNLLGLDESEFLKRTKGTIKLGIEFSNWRRKGDSYLHAFGNIGLDLGMAKFYQYWFKRKAQGCDTDLWDYSFNAQAAYQSRFQPKERIEGTPLSGLTYAFHFDAGLYANYLREIAEGQGVERIEGTVKSVTLSAENGFIDSIEMESGASINGELFIDCSGFRGLLIEEALDAGFENWSDFLPCDRAVAVACESDKSLIPFTKSIAHQAGWQWRIPLQHRIGNGHVFCSAHINDDKAIDTLLSNLDGAPTSDPKVIKFETGMRKAAWIKNCVAVGLSAGFMEPLESTSIHLIQSAISRLLNLFPDKSFASRDRDEFNNQTRFEFERIRDFLVLHYKLTERDDSEFWKACRDMSIPTSLEDKIELFKSHGRIFRDNDELFTDLGWVQVMVGQGLMPSRHHPIVDSVSDQQIEKFMQDLKQIFAREASRLTFHHEYISQHAS